MNIETEEKKRYRYKFDNVIKKLLLRSSAILFIFAISMMVLIMNIAETDTDIVILSVYGIVFFVIAVLGLIETFSYSVLIDKERIYVRHFFSCKSVQIGDIVNIKRFEDKSFSKYRIITDEASISVYAIDNIYEQLRELGLEISGPA